MSNPDARPRPHHDGNHPIDELTARSSSCFGVLWRKMPQCAFCPLGVKFSDCKSEYDHNMEQRRVRRKLAAMAISGKMEVPGQTLAQSLGLDLNGIIDLAQGLTPNEREILKLVFARDWSLRRIAKSLEMHHEQVRRLYARALKKVEKGLKTLSG